MKNNFERLIEHIINEDEAKAKALFHKIVVEKSRSIYESLVEDDEAEIGAGDDVESLGDEITADQDVIDGDEEGMDSDFGDDGDEFGADDGDIGDEERSEEDRIMDLEDAIDELKAEFDELMGNEAAEEENFPGIHDDSEGEDDFSGEDDFDSDEGGDNVGDAELDGEIAGEPEMESTSVYGESRKSPQELMREYVEKVTAVNPSEGDPIGSGGSKSPINAKSTQISGKNDMGGTTANIARGGNEGGNPSGPKKPSNAYTKGQKEVDGASSWENRPAANTKGYKDRKSAKTKEGSDTAGSSSVSKTSLEPGGKPGFKG